MPTKVIDWLDYLILYSFDEYKKTNRTSRKRRLGQQHLLHLLLLSKKKHDILHGISIYENRYFGRIVLESPDIEGALDSLENDGFIKSSPSRRHGWQYELLPAGQQACDYLRSTHESGLSLDIYLKPIIKKYSYASDLKIQGAIHNG